MSIKSNKWLVGRCIVLTSSMLAGLLATSSAMAEPEGGRSVVSVIEGEELTISGQSASQMVKHAVSGSTQLTGIAAKDRGSVTEVRFSGLNMNASYNAFLLEDGKAMVVDFWNASSQLSEDHFKYATQRVTGVTVGDAGGRVRVVIELLARKDVTHQIEATDHELVVRFGQVTPRKKQGVLTVESVDFTPDDRIAHVIIRTDITNPVVSMREEKERVFIDIQKAQLGLGLERSLDVSAFPGPVRQMDSYEVDGNVRIVARLRDKVRVTSFQEGNVLTVSVVPEDIALAKARGGAGEEKFAYVGQKVTFDFKDIEVQNALKLIGEVSKLNIIMSDEVTGNLTMRLVDVPWDQALDLILLSQGLDKQTVGNVVRVAPIEVLRSEYEAQIEAQKGSAQLEPLVTEFIPLSYARVEDVKKMFESAASNATKGGVTTITDTGLATTSTAETTIGILSSRGSFLVDERTNTLIIKDTEESINNVKRLISTIDKPVEQVLIEARIVEATDSFQRDIGIRWGGTYTTVGNRALTIGAGNSSTARNIDNLSNGDPIEHGFLVDLPAAVGAGVGGAVGLSIARLNSPVVLDLELSAAEADGDIKIVSNPRVITTNLRKALISQGAKVSFETVSQDGTKTEFIDAVLSLEVTPQITADNHVIMEVIVSKDNATLNITGDGTNIDTKAIETEIFMADGDTVVIGGIFTRNTSKAESGIPGLSKLPLLGWLFKKERVQDDKTELLIFLTPKVVKTTARNSAI